MKIIVGLSGHYKVFTKSEKHGRILRAEFDNLILDVGLERPGLGVPISECQVGSGTSTPVASQTALDSLVATTSSKTASNTTFVDGATPYSQVVMTYRFAEGSATGILAEVGMGWGGGLFSRARILDSGGSPTTIEILADETLDVEYTLRVYPPTSDVTGSRTIAGVATAYVYRPALISDEAMWSAARFADSMTEANAAYFSIYSGDATLGTKYEQPSASDSANPSSVSTADYVNFSRKRKMTAHMGLDNGNFSGGIGAALAVSTSMAFQASFSPDVAKMADYVATLDFSVAWARKT